MMTRVYRYGLLAPTENADRVRAEMLGGHRHRNTLTEIERGRRAYVRSVVAELGDEDALVLAKDDARATVESLAAAVKRERARTRTRTDCADAREALKLARVRLKDATKALNDYRHEVRTRPDVVAKLEEVNGATRGPGAKRDNKQKNEGRAAQLVRAARELRECAWGTGALAEKAVAQAKAAPLYLDGEPNDPRFRRWTGEGVVAVQIQREAGDAPMTAKELFAGSDTFLRVDPVDERAWLSPERRERRCFSRTVLHMRVGSDGRMPIWASWPMIMHRALPEGAEIAGASVSLRHIGPRDEWSCEMTVRVPDVVRRCGAGDGVVAVRLGWARSDSGGLRAASCLSATGERFEIDLAPVDGRGVESGLAKANEIRGGRDKDFNAARSALVARLDALTPPVWFVEATKTLAQWRSAGRLAALVKRWSAARWVGDEDAFTDAEAWRYHDFHLWEWETSQRVKSRRRRLDGYRVAAADMVRKFGEIVIVDVDLAKAARLKPVESESGEAMSIRLARVRVAAYELRTAIKSAAASAGCVVREVKSAPTACPGCEFDEPASVDKTTQVFSCVGCGLRRDVAGVALMNVLRAAGHGEAVDAMVRREHEAAERLRGIAAE